MIMISLSISLSLSIMQNKYSIQHQNRYASLLFSSKQSAATVDPVASGEALKIAPKGGETILRCDGLTKSYTGVPQLDNVSLCICKGQRIGLVGKYGLLHHYHLYHHHYHHYH